MKNSFKVRDILFEPCRGITVLLLLFIYATGCNMSPTNSKDPLEVLDTQVNFEMIDSVRLRNNFLTWSDFRKKYRNVSIVYLQDGCAPCYPKFINWHKRMEQIAKADDYTVLFVINARDYASFTRNTPVYQSIEERYYYFIDPRNEFFRTNSNIPRVVLDRSLLIDRDNRIKMIGEPFTNGDMTKVFHIVTGVEE